ncbi:DUF1254 domain-containing protein [Aureliella helgolandensis]|uniref:Proton-gated ion channel n=1 Tax=Aureliella helgolandensis TaxID=2527968 RepID=A0A518G6H9_9BACT|nr:DUF1254 domain-containing protein [Aureliella helgolandensis]QDV24191.1 Proton-gated ion channel precursor [Aureliella helgolandensis]
MHTGPQVINSVFLACAAFAATIMPHFSQAQELSSVEAQTIAREAYIFGFPIVESYRSMYDSAIDTTAKEFKAPLNTLKHEANLFTPADKGVVTPNADTPYSFLWMDLRNEPVVLGVPAIEKGRYYSIQMTDLFKFNFDYIGSRVTGNGAGQFLIAGPNWTGETPTGISKVIRCETEFALAIYRTQLLGPDDLENVKDIQKQYTSKTLSEFAGEPKPAPAIETEFPLPLSDAGADLAFFSTLNFILPFCPPHASEQELITRLARMGVIAGEPFNVDAVSPEIQEALAKGMAEGEAAITAAAAKLKVAEVIGAREFLGSDYLIKRAVAAKLGRYTNSKEEALYPLYLSDAEGKPLDGSAANYVLNIGPEELPPVSAFWSITVYDSQSNTLAPNPISRYRISSSMIDSLDRDAKGGLTIAIQLQSPEEEAANWLPAPNGPFYMVMRLYWPKPEAYDGTWTPPLVWKADSAPTATVQKPAGAEAAEEVKPSVLVDEPKPEMERPTVWGEPTEVQVAIFVIDVDEVDSADQSFAASVYYEARWKNPLLRHKGPGPMHRNISDVWSPRLTIIGQQMAWRSFPESVDIQPDGIVISRQKVWGRFSQPLMLRDFPFDQQTLSIQLVAAGLSEEHVKMVPLVNEAGRSSSIASKFSLPDFTVESWEAMSSPYHPDGGDVGVAGYEMKINIHRQSTFYILKVIIPLCLIVIMSWLPRWIDPEQTGTNIGVSTSAFLTLVAYLFAITVLLPRVSYITRMDRFILLSTLTVFAGLIQTVVNTVLIRGKKLPRAERIDRWSRFVYPILLAIVLGYSFLF